MRRRVGDELPVKNSPVRRFAQRSGYRFVITAKGRMDNASASYTGRAWRGRGRKVKKSWALLIESVSGNSIIVSFHNSPIGGNPTREESRGAITTIHFSAKRRAKLTQHSANVPLARIGRYSLCWKISACPQRKRRTRWVRNNFIRPSGHVCVSASGVVRVNAPSIPRRR